jgi:hypothetical protein
VTAWLFKKGCYDTIGRNRVARWFAFKPKIPIWVNFGGSLNWKMLKYFMAIWNILQTFEIIYDHLVQFVFIWYIFSGFGIMRQEKSGNPAVEAQNISLNINSKL